MQLARLKHLFRFAYQPKNGPKKPAQPVKKKYHRNATLGQRFAANASEEARTPENALFPYKFKGQKTYPKDRPSIDKWLPSQRPFQQLYRSFLEATNAQKQKQLAELVHPQMVEYLLNKDLKFTFLNKEKPIQILISGYTLSTSKEVVINKQQQIKTLKDLWSVVLNTEYSWQTYKILIKEGLPIYIQFETTILSKARLALPGDQQEKQEAHNVTFRYERYLSLIDQIVFRFYGLKFIKKIVKDFDENQIFKNLTYKDNKKWRIVNIDSFFKPHSE